jgi:hypothetical protein
MLKGMGIKNGGWLYALLMLSPAVDARDGQFTIVGGAGTTNLSIDPDYRIGVGQSSFDAGTLSLVGGYRFSNGFVVEAGYVSYATFELFNSVDEYELNDWQAAIGYSYALERWRFVAKAGYAFWDLDGEEGTFLPRQRGGVPPRRQRSGMDARHRKILFGHFRHVAILPEKRS